MTNFSEAVHIVSDGSNSSDPIETIQVPLKEAIEGNGEEESKFPVFDPHSSSPIDGVDEIDSTESETPATSPEITPSAPEDREVSAKPMAKKEIEDYEKKRIQNAIMNATDNEIEDLWIPMIMENQTPSEKEDGAATLKNGMGLNKLDSEFITSLHEQILSGKRLSYRQVETAKKRLLKYWRQFSVKFPETKPTKTPENIEKGQDAEGSKEAEINSIFETEEDVSLRDIMMSISKSGKILKHRPISSRYTSRYEFVINGKSFTIDGSQLFNGHQKFAEYYTDIHMVVPFKENRPTKTQWDSFIEWVLKHAEDAGFEENNSVMAAKWFVSHLENNFTVTEDPSIFTQPGSSGYKILKCVQQGGEHAGEAFLILPSSVVELIVAEEMPVRVSSAELANALRALGYMSGKTRGKKLNLKNRQCWWFYPDKLNIDTDTDICDSEESFLVDP